VPGNESHLSQQYSLVTNETSLSQGVFYAHCTSEKCLDCYSLEVLPYLDFGPVICQFAQKHSGPVISFSNACL
jgi:hypothetical protein